MEPRKPGRPRTSSVTAIEEAATELFLEKTFAGTSIDEIAQRAGVSRTTFFNYFESKNDLLFIPVDRAAENLRLELKRSSELEPFDAIEAALLVTSDDFGNHVPLSISQQDVMGVAAEVRTLRALNISRVTEILTDFLADELGRPTSDLLVKVAAASIAGTLDAAGIAWATDGPERAPLIEYIQRGMAFVRNGLGRAL